MPVDPLSVATVGVLSSYEETYVFSISTLGFIKTAEISDSIVELAAGRRRVGAGGGSSSSSVNDQNINEEKRNNFNVFIKTSIMSLARDMNNFMPELTEEVQYVGSLPKVNVVVENIEINKVAPPVYNLKIEKIKPLKIIPKSSNEIKIDVSFINITPKKTI